MSITESSSPLDGSVSADDIYAAEDAAWERYEVASRLVCEARRRSEACYGEYVAARNARREALGVDV